MFTFPYFFAYEFRIQLLLVHFTTSTDLQILFCDGTRRYINISIDGMLMIQIPKNSQTQKHR